jgi:hypothetical protein
MPLEEWRDNAINWIHHHTDDLPDRPPSPYHVAKPTTQARQNAALIIRELQPDFFAPCEMTVTHERGIELGWRNGNKELTVQIMADGSLEILHCIDDSIIDEHTFSGLDWRLGRSFDWLAS